MATDVTPTNTRMIKVVIAIATSNSTRVKPRREDFLRWVFMKSRVKKFSG